MLTSALSNIKLYRNLNVKMRCISVFQKKKKIFLALAYSRAHAFKQDVGQIYLRGCICALHSIFNTVTIEFELLGLADRHSWGQVFSLT